MYIISQFFLYVCNYFIRHSCRKCVCKLIHSYTETQAGNDWATWRSNFTTEKFKGFSMYIHSVKTIQCTKYDNNKRERAFVLCNASKCATVQFLQSLLIQKICRDSLAFSTFHRTWNSFESNGSFKAISCFFISKEYTQSASSNVYLSEFLSTFEPSDETSNR